MKVTAKVFILENLEKLDNFLKFNFKTGAFCLELSQGWLNTYRALGLTDYFDNNL